MVGHSRGLREKTQRFDRRINEDFRPRRFLAPQPEDTQEILHKNFRRPHRVAPAVSGGHRELQLASAARRQTVKARFRRIGKTGRIVRKTKMNIGRGNAPPVFQKDRKFCRLPFLHRQTVQPLRHFYPPTDEPGQDIRDHRQKNQGKKHDLGFIAS